MRIARRIVVVCTEAANGAHDMTTVPSHHQPSAQPEPLPNGDRVRVAKREWFADVVVAISVGAFASFYLFRALV
jgi:hypothetical protein